MAEVFLSSESRMKWPKHTYILKTCFDELLSACSRGLEKNKSFPSDSNAFQESLEVGFNNLSDLLKNSNSKYEDLNLSSSPLLSLSKLKKFNTIQRRLSDTEEDSSN